MKSRAIEKSSGGESRRALSYFQLDWRRGHKNTTRPTMKLLITTAFLLSVAHASADAADEATPSSLRRRLGPQQLLDPKTQITKSFADQASLAKELLTEERFEAISKKLTHIIDNKCTSTNPGAGGKVCNDAIMKEFCLENQPAIKPNINFIDPPIPWVDMGDLQWQGNFYMDFIVWYIFFSGQVAHDTERPENAGPHRYFESGVSNGLHASNSWTLGEQLGWKGLMVELSQCGPCQAVVNHPSGDFVHAGICEQDTTLDIKFSDFNMFCKRQENGCDAYRGGPVPCRSMPSLFHEKGLTWVDFMSLDMEAVTPMAWNTFDHGFTNVRVATVESTWPNIMQTKHSDMFHLVNQGGEFFAWKKNAFRMVENPCAVIDTL